MCVNEMCSSVCVCVYSVCLFSLMNRFHLAILGVVVSVCVFKYLCSVYRLFLSERYRYEYLTRGRKIRFKVIGGDDACFW